jgi:hypothetical protein
MNMSKKKKRLALQAPPSPRKAARARVVGVPFAADQAQPLKLLGLAGDGRRPKAGWT